jgi:predicted AAA+ superfamily ATPase
VAAIVERPSEERALKALVAEFPVTALLGPRQCGKTTLAARLGADRYFDLEDPRAARQMDDPLLALEELRGLIVIDEFQRRPELFPVLRSLVDRRLGQRYLILGSASRELLRQSSESLAGRIAYYELAGLRISDLPPDSMPRLWLRGGFPSSAIARTEDSSIRWRANYVSTFLERDIPQLGIPIPAATMRRFWEMLSHYHGQLLNYSELGRSFGISDTTARRYVDILESTFMLRLLQPWHENLGKRLVKSPKLYVRDSGLFHTLQTIESRRQLLVHNRLGASWEGFIVEEIAKVIRTDGLYFWRTHNGAELDLFWRKGGRSWGVEVKWASAPEVTPSMRIAAKDLELSHLWVVYPGSDTFKLAPGVTVLPVSCVREPWPYPAAKRK